MTLCAKGRGSGDDSHGGPERDALIEETEKEMAEHSAASKLFDIRFLIGGVFVLYGVIVLIVGLVEGIPAKYAANEININVWTGFRDARRRGAVPGVGVLRPGRARA